MADVLTTVFGFIKQTIGGNRNTWGGLLNSNFDIVEAGLAGQLAKALIGGSVTLTDTERRNRILSFTGTLASDQTVVVANLPSVWLVKNGTSGAFAVSMKTASGDPVAIPQGGWQIVWCDGANGVFAGPTSLLFSTQFKAPDGTISAPGIAFLNEVTLGIRRAGYASGTLASNPFTTSNGSANVTVHHVGHGLSANDNAFYDSATAVGGITIDGTYPVVSITDADNYVITHSAVATSGATGGGTPNYKYMKAAATGGAIALTKGGADIVHISPYGCILPGELVVSGIARFKSALSIVGALTGAAATFSGLLTGAAATFSGLLTLSSTSHMVPPTGTTAQRPGSPAESNFRYNSDLHVVEWFDGTNWIQPQLAHPPLGSSTRKHIDVATNTTVTVDVTNFVMSDGTNYFTEDISCTVDLGSAGAVNKLDQGSITAATTYYLWGIRKPDGTKGAIASKSSDGSNNGGLLLPTGYTAKAYLGPLRTAPGSAQLYGTKQRGRRVDYIVGLAQTTRFPLMESGAKGSVTTTSGMSAVAIGSFVPPTAAVIRVGLGVFVTSGGAGSQGALAGPNNNFGAYNDTSNPPPLNVRLFQSTPATASATEEGSFQIEGTNIYYASDATFGYLFCRGFDEDYG